MRSLQLMRFRCNFLATLLGADPKAKEKAKAKAKAISLAKAKVLSRAKEMAKAIDPEAKAFHHLQSRRFQCDKDFFP